jgi:hypothetical protein
VESSPSASELNRVSTVHVVPASARNIRYYTIAALDAHEYIYFIDKRDNIDAFARSLIGGDPGPYDQQNNMIDRIPHKWWIHDRVPDARGGTNTGALEGVDVLIKDSPDYSEVWVFKSSD